MLERGVLFFFFFSVAGVKHSEKSSFGKDQLDLAHGAELESIVVGRSRGRSLKWLTTSYMHAGSRAQQMHAGTQHTVSILCN